MPRENHNHWRRPSGTHQRPPSIRPEQMFNSGPPLSDMENMPPPPVPRVHAPRPIVPNRTLPPSELSPLQYQDVAAYCPIVRPTDLTEQPIPSRYPYPQTSRLPSQFDPRPAAFYNQPPPNLTFNQPYALTHSGVDRSQMFQMFPAQSSPTGLFELPQPGLYRTTAGSSEQTPSGPSRTPGSSDRPQVGPSRPASCPFDRSQATSYTSVSGPRDGPQAGPSRTATASIERSPTLTSRPLQGPFDRSVAGPSRPSCTGRRASPINRSMALENVKKYQRINQARASDEPMHVKAQNMSEKLIQITAQGLTFESTLFCPHCGGIPQMPVTGPCGHTMCRSCATNHKKCACGEETVWTAINILVQRLLNSLKPEDKFVRLIIGAAEMKEKKDLGTAAASARQQISAPSSPSGFQQFRVPTSCFNDRYQLREVHSVPGLCRLVAPPGEEESGNQVRYMFGRDLVAAGCYNLAVPHLVKAATFGPPSLAELSKDLLVKALQKLCNKGEIWRVTNPLNSDVLFQSSIDWLRSRDLECILCCQSYRNPVTTPCGHTFCRPCVERSMDYGKCCPLCGYSLDDFNVASTLNTSFLVHAIEATGRSVAEAPDSDDRLPIFVCTVAFPTVPCPLYVFEPRYRLMIRRCMRSETRRFGMVEGDKDQGYAEFGTILEIRDCVLLADGRCILSTVGVSRFQVLDRDERDGYDVARVVMIADFQVSNLSELCAQNQETWQNAKKWLLSIDAEARAAIETSFGSLPPAEDFDLYKPDGPAWLWWVLAILPLRSEIKVMILSALNVSKRLFAIEHTLYVMDFRADTNPAAKDPLMPAPCNSENWLQRAA